MKLSIITCTYNSEKYLQDCINSVISQNLDIDVYEHIFVDAKSKDKTKSIINEYMSKYKNVRLIEREPKWVYNAMNEWIKEAKGEYVMCLNSDDYLCKDILSQYIWYIEKNDKYDCFYWKLNVLVDWNLKTQDDKFFHFNRFLFENFWSNLLIYHPTVIVKKSILLEMGLFAEDKKIASDYWMWLKMLVCKKLFCYYPKNITIFRYRKWSLSSSNENLGKEEVKYFRKLYLWKCKFIIWLIIDDLLNIYMKIKSHIT